MKKRKTLGIAVLTILGSLTLTTPSQAHIGKHSYKLSNISKSDITNFCNTSNGHACEYSGWKNNLCNWKHPGIGAYANSKGTECWDDWWSWNPNH